jgi:hypothetical protein
MTNAMCLPVKIMASDIDSFNRSAVSASTDVDNGLVFQLLTQSTAATGKGEVWLATVPTTANSGLKNLWMSWSPEVVEVVSGSNVFKGIDNDPQHFTNIEGEVFDAFMPQIGDIITLTSDALGGTKASALYVQVDATNNVYKLTWNTTGTLAGLSLKYIETTSISKPTAGAISESQSVTAYKFQVASIA